MKKRIGILLAAAMAASLTVTSFAANLGEYMPDDVIQWLQEGEAKAETVDEQAVNGTARLVEMLSLIANVNATEDQAQLLTEKMDKLNQALESENLSAAQVHGVVASLLPAPLYVLSQQADSQGLNAEKLDGLLAEFEQADEATELDEEQTANALKYAVLFTAAVTEEICPDEEGQQQIEAGIGDFTTELTGVEDIKEQQLVSTKWLCKMLGAFVKLQKPENYDAVELLVEDAQQQADEAAGPAQASIFWLYNSVNMAAGLIGTINSAS